LHPSSAEDGNDRELVEFLLAEQSALQAALSGTISESGSRMSSFFAAVSGSVVAIAFVAQLSAFTETVRIFALVLLPTLLFLGLVTFERLLQMFMLETLCHRGMNRIRHFFLERNPSASTWLSLSTHDDLTGVSRSGGSHRLKPGADPKQILISAPGTVAVIDGIVLGVIAALVATALGAGLFGAAAAGIVAALVLVVLLLVHELRAFASAQKLDPIRFHSPETGVAAPRWLQRIAGFDGIDPPGPNVTPET